ncbi:hypothetical protein [Acidovorax cavernicola]|uniref:hypothetical protein n=1 Tax=Acidovorax cavernicola TaxID=1675792 RepID=UPI0011C3C4FD|nr:hypothetical protein [Acidovorax cavernicola]
MNGLDLHWPALTMAVALAYAAWHARREQCEPRDVKALWVASALSLAGSGMLALASLLMSE